MISIGVDMCWKIYFWVEKDYGIENLVVSIDRNKLDIEIYKEQRNNPMH